jgi:hypothetical protein
MTSRSRRYFGLLHLAELITLLYAGIPSSAVTNVGDVMLTAVIRCYGVARTRPMLPW